MVIGCRFLLLLQNLEQWTLRMSWLDLQLMFRQFNTNSSELNQWLDTVAKAAIDVFQLTSTGGHHMDDKKYAPTIVTAVKL